MTRLRADLILLLVAIIWGTTFVAQKLGQHLGPFSFIGVRFLMSFLVVLPFVWRETKGRLVFRKAYLLPGALLCIVFTLGVILQQVGLAFTSVTNSGFLTGLTVIIVPFIELLLFRKPPRRIIWLASLVSLLGIWLLNGMSVIKFNKGDMLTIGCALAFALQISLIGRLIQGTGRPVAWAALEYLACSLAGFLLSVLFERITVGAIVADIGPLLYAGIMSGGIAYTLQGVAQQYTSASKAALITSSESLFAAMSGYIILNENLTMAGWLGCGMIFIAICLAEFPVVKFYWRRK